MRLLVILFALTFVLPGYAYAFEWADLGKAEVLTPILAILLAVSELLGAIDVIKPNGVIQAVIDVVAGLIKKILGNSGS